MATKLAGASGTAPSPPSSPVGSVRFALPTRAPKTMRSYGDSARLARGLPA